MKKYLFLISILILAFGFLISCRKPQINEPDLAKVIGSFRVTGDIYNNTFFEIRDTSESCISIEDDTIKLVLMGYMPNTHDETFQITAQYVRQSDSSFSWDKNLKDNIFQIDIKSLSNTQKWLPDAGTLSFKGMYDSSVSISGTFSGRMFNSDNKSITYQISQGTYVINK